MNIHAIRGSADDSYRYNPWRAPGTAPVRATPRVCSKQLHLPTDVAGRVAWHCRSSIRVAKQVASTQRRPWVATRSTTTRLGQPWGTWAPTCRCAPSFRRNLAPVLDLLC